MAAISGRLGSLVVNDGSANTVGLCTEWTLDINTDTEEITAFGSAGWKERMYMMSEWSGSATVKWDAADAGQSSIHKKGFGMISGTIGSVTISLYVDAAKHYEGVAFIKSMSIKTPANGIVEADIQFEGSGALAYNAT